MTSERELIHFRTTADGHCFRVLITYAGIQYSMSFSRFVYDRAAPKEQRQIRGSWKVDIHLWCQRMREGTYGWREFVFQNPRKRGAFDIAEWR
jgi:hypothetical protein